MIIESTGKPVDFLIEQFRDAELAKVYMKQYVDDPLSYQGIFDKNT